MRISPRPLTPDSTLNFTGERFLPEVRGAIFYEHWHRYAAVSPLVAGKRVLDAASGEGYGSFLLAQAAAHVTGVDLSPDAVAHAAQRYPRENLHYVAGSVTGLPLADGSVDVVVSFETIEHLPAQAEMLAEFRRVLTPDGVLIISSPNRPVYNEAGGEANHYHMRELDRDELAALLAPRFPQQAWYAQRVIAQSALWAEGAHASAPACITLAGDAAATARAPAPPMYFIVIAGAQGVALPALPALSLFDDGALSLWNDYARALMRERTLAWDEIAARKVAEDRLAELVPALNALGSARQAQAAQAARIDDLEATLADLRTRAQAAIDDAEAARRREQATALELARTQDAFTDEAQAHAQARAALAQEAAAHAQTREHLAYRESARGWLRYPLAAVRARLAGPSKA